MFLFFYGSDADSRWHFSSQEGSASRFLLTTVKHVHNFNELCKAESISIIYFEEVVNMIEVTDAAYEKIAEFFKDKTIRPVRVLLNPGG